MVQMPDHGELQVEHFKHQDYVFSGHFHKRQSRGKVHYIGNAFPHNFADAWDDDRGMMILEWGSEPEYINWPNCPKYRALPLSRLIDEKDTLMKSKMYLKVNLDIDITFEEANYIKEEFTNKYDIREISLIQDKTNLDNSSEESLENTFSSVDQIVTDGLVNLENGQFNSNLLLEIYNDL